MQKSRLLYTGKNIIWGYVSSIVTIILSFVTRTAFIKTIGIGYLGINGLFSNVLGVLSLTELGIGTAMTYSLYRPIAEDNTEKIKSLMMAYKKAYRVVAIIVCALGVVLIPFLKYLVKGADGIEHVQVYYAIFLFNTVSSYFVSYKYGLLNADQRNYLVTNIVTITNIVTNIVQIILLVLFKNYLVYLITQAVILLVQKVYTFFYIDKFYPYLKDKDVKPLDEEEKKKLFTNIKALIYHKLGDVSVNQTDNIIISAFVNVSTVGLISNYQLISSTVSIFFNNIFNGMTGSLGNLFATDEYDKQYKIFKVIDLCSFWVYAYSTIMIFALVEPFISIIWGSQYLIDTNILIVFLINYYMVGQRLAVYNVKVASGVFVQDRFLAIIQSVINLVISIVLAKLVGTIGVFIGTVIAGLVPSLIRPYILFRDVLNKPVAEYYIRHFRNICLMVMVGTISFVVSKYLLFNPTILKWIGSAFILTVIINGIFILLFRKTEDYKYLKATCFRYVRLIRK